MQVNLIEVVRNTILTEAETLFNLSRSVDETTAAAILKMASCRGKIVITGIGKSALVGKKIVATLVSTGSHAMFMHAADALHGDMGIINNEDIVLCISKSGNTPEIKVLIPFLRNMGVAIFGMGSHRESFLAQSCDFFFYIPVEKEADPNNLAPTASTTAQMAMGDAIAIALLSLKGFSSADFAGFHPGGNLGKQLYARVSDIFSHGNTPHVTENDDLHKVIVAISGGRMGACAVLDNLHQLKGIITDGDLRRMLQKSSDIQEDKAADIMSINPKTISSDTLAVEAFQIMKENKITQLLVLDEGKYIGILHLHDMIKEGFV
jgi:arabinose-5-phosphate isomerase